MSPVLCADTSASFLSETLSAPCISRTPARELFTVECSRCGYEVHDSVCGPEVCPKCLAAGTFHRVTVPASILAHADAYPEGTDPRIGFARHFLVSSAGLYFHGTKKVNLSPMKRNRLASVMRDRRRESNGDEDACAYFTD